MRIEIISGGETSLYAIPEQVEFIGITLENEERDLNIVAGIPDCLEKLPIECVNQEYRLAEGMTLTAHLYTLQGKARVLSWKPYPDFPFYDLHFGGVHIKVYG